MTSNQSCGNWESSCVNIFRKLALPKRRKFLQCLPCRQNMKFKNYVSNLQRLTLTAATNKWRYDSKVKSNINIIQRKPVRFLNNTLRCRFQQNLNHYCAKKLWVNAGYFSASGKNSSSHSNSEVTPKGVVDAHGCC